MNPGRMNKLIQIQAKSKDQDAAGQPLEVFVLVADLWAEINPLIGKELLLAGEIGSEVTHNVTIRYKPNIRPDQRIIYKNRIFEIIYVINKNEDNEFMYLKCKEVFLA